MKKPLSEKRHRNAYEDDEDLDWLYDEKDVAEAVSEFEDSFYSKLRKLGFSTHEESRIIEAHRESEKEIFGEFSNNNQIPLTIKPKAQKGCGKSFESEIGKAQCGAFCYNEECQKIHLCPECQKGVGK